MLSGSISASSAAVATAASTALPPCLRMSSPACAASGWLVATIPWRASTSDRVWSAHPLARSPRTFWIVRPGVGIAAVGVPNGVPLVVWASVYPAPPTSNVPTASADASRTRDFI